MSFTSSPKMGQGTKLLIEMGPLVAFFVANWKAGIFWGTGIFMVATVIALIASWVLTRKIAMVPLVSAVFVALFGKVEVHRQFLDRFDERLVVLDLRFEERPLAEHLAGLLAVVPQPGILAAFVYFLEPGPEIGQVKDAAPGALHAPAGR